MKDRTRGRIADIMRAVFDEMEEHGQGEVVDHTNAFERLIDRFIDEGFLSPKVHDYCRLIDGWLDERKGQTFTARDLTCEVFSHDERSTPHFRSWFNLTIILMLRAGRMCETKNRGEFYMTRL